jgi:hypothetical protein
MGRLGPQLRGRENNGASSICGPDSAGHGMRESRPEVGPPAATESRAPSDEGHAGAIENAVSTAVEPILTAIRFEPRQLTFAPFLVTPDTPTRVRTRQTSRRTPRTSRCKLPTTRRSVPTERRKFPTRVGARKEHADNRPARPNPSPTGAVWGNGRGLSARGTTSSLGAFFVACVGYAVLYAGRRRRRGRVAAARRVGCRAVWGRGWRDMTVTSVPALVARARKVKKVGLRVPATGEGIVKL